MKEDGHLIKLTNASAYIGTMNCPFVISSIALRKMKSFKNLYVKG